MTDPITELVACLTRGEAPPLAWVVRWCDRDSIARAWRESRDGMSMVVLLSRGTTVSPHATDMLGYQARSALHESMHYVGVGLTEIATGEYREGGRMLFGAATMCGSAIVGMSAAALMRWNDLRELHSTDPPILTELLARHRIR
jgi:hypothetical protein